MPVYKVPKVYKVQWVRRAFKDLPVSKDHRVSEVRVLKASKDIRVSKDLKEQGVQVPRV